MLGRGEYTTPDQAPLISHYATRTGKKIPFPAPALVDYQRRARNRRLACALAVWHRDTFQTGKR